MGKIEKTDYEAIQSYTQKISSTISEEIAYNIKTVEISKEEYERLLDKEAKLNALECAGVDNWSGYGYAMNELLQAEEEINND